MAWIKNLVRGRGFTEGDMLEGLNREVAPAVGALSDELNRISGAALTIVAGSHYLANTDRVALADAAAGAVIAYLPAAAAAEGCWFSMKKIDATGNAAIFSAADLIDGAGTNSNATQYNTVTVYCDGSTYHVM